MLNKRLRACADFVSGRGIACDVGTDHAYLAAELLKSGKCREVIASDVAEGPLMAAERTLNQAGLMSKARIILSDGLTQIPPDNVTDVVIAGMGGETIVHILSSCEWIKSDVNLILQPMTKAALLREWLCSNGFFIIEEKIVHDGRFFYTVMRTSYTGENFQLSDFNRELGFQDWTDEVVKDYGRFRIAHYKRLSSQMAEAQPEKAEIYRKIAEELAEKTGEDTK